MTREDVFEYAQKEYGTSPEYLWNKWPEYGVLRHSGNRKWYAIVMNVRCKVLGLDGEGEVDILDVKCDPAAADFLIHNEGFLPAYHMNKNNWITVLLDGTVPNEQILDLIDASYIMTAPKTKKRKEEQ